MNSRLFIFVLVVLLLAGIAGCPAPEEEPAAPAEEVSQAVEKTPDKKVTELETMCAEAADAMAARQTEATLYDRVGGREGIHAIVADTVARHQANDKIVQFMAGVDPDHLISQVTDFLVVGTGGEGEYVGRNMVDAHAHLELSNVEFLAAGSDLNAAMEAAGWGENESQELLCAFVALRSEVVTR